MQLARCALRMLVAGIVVAASLSRGNAFGQTLDVSGPNTDSTTNLPGPVPFGGNADYTATFKPAADATGVVLTVTPPTVAAPFGTGDKLAGVGAVTGGQSCTTDATTNDLTCPVGAVTAGTPVEVAFSLQLPFLQDADGNDIAPPTCPDPATTLGSTTVTVAAGATTIITQAVPNTVGPVSDLVADLNGPATANQGDVITFTSNIVNNGPCPADNVTVTSAAGAGLVLQSGPCDAFATDGCNLGTLAVGQATSITSKYKVASLTNNLITSGVPNGIAVTSDAADPTPSDAAPTSATQVSTGTGGCSSAGTPGPWAAAVLALLGMAAWRRRRA